MNVKKSKSKPNLIIYNCLNYTRNLKKQSHSWNTTYYHYFAIKIINIKYAEHNLGSLHELDKGNWISHGIMSLYKDKIDAHKIIKIVILRI